ncbi:MAG: Mediator of RNA polymerase II transcription subunit 18 [Alectoria sarmentosa]|nr:MAG: Mediator of RNA polymerase II transcription subunit 18 [Alectoria sarmentosa]
MHELLLFGAIPPSRHTQLLNILSGISSMQPRPIHLEKHLVFKPNRLPGSIGSLKVGGAQDVNVHKSQIQAHALGDLFYMQLVAEVEEGRDEEQWVLQFRDLPEVARQRAVTSRLVADVPVTSGDPMEFMKALDYSHVSTYTISGHRFTHHSASLVLYRVTLPATAVRSDSTSGGPPQARLLDPSGTYILQASVRVQDGSKVETMTKGVNELLGLKETLKGVVELEIGDRLALDTRVR